MKTIYLDNDYEPEYSLRRRNTDTGASEPASGLLGLKMRLSKTDGGAAVHASLNDIAAVERTKKLGTYFSVFQGSDLRAHIASEPKVFVIFGDADNVLISEPHLVAAIRRPGGTADG